MSNKNLQKLATADQIRVLLKKNGPMSATETGNALGITREAARQQFGKLEATGEVETFTEPQPIGRPQRRWTLTPAGHSKFGDRHAELAVWLLSSIERQLGKRGVDVLVSQWGDHQIEKYTKKLDGEVGLERRLRALATVRDAEGHVTEWKTVDGDYQLVEYHSPLYTACVAFPLLWEVESDLLRKALGDGVSVVVIEHLAKGDRRCIYQFASGDA